MSRKESERVKMEDSENVVAEDLSRRENGSSEESKNRIVEE